MNYQEFKKLAASPIYQGNTEQKIQSFSKDINKATPGIFSKGWAGIKSLWNPNAKNELIDSTMNNMRQYADKFVDSMDINDIEFAQKNYNYFMQRYFGGNGNSPQARQFATYVRDGLGRKAFRSIMQNPVANLPKAAGIFIRQYGSRGVGDFIANPIAFYGLLAGALSVPSLISRGEQQ